MSKDEKFLPLGPSKRQEAEPIKPASKTVQVSPRVVSVDGKFETVMPKNEAAKLDWQTRQIMKSLADAKGTGELVYDGYYVWGGVMARTEKKPVPDQVVSKGSTYTCAVVGDWSKHKVYVDSVNGDDSNPGTQVSPRKTFGFTIPAGFLKAGKSKVGMRVERTEKPRFKMSMQRRDTAENWYLSNPVLMAGEIGVDTDNDQVYVGNGASTWRQLVATAWKPVEPQTGDRKMTSEGPRIYCEGFGWCEVLEHRSKYGYRASAYVNGSWVLVDADISTPSGGVVVKPPWAQ